MCLSSSSPIRVTGRSWRAPPTGSPWRRLAFPGEDVELDEHPRTIDMLRARRLDDPVLVIGSDQLADLPNWKEPEAVLELARLAVAVRPGFAWYDAAGRALKFFEIEPTPVSSTEIRRRVAAGEPIDGLVPPAVAAEIERLGLYRELDSDRSLGDRTALTSLEQARRIAGIAQEKLARDVVILDMRPVCTYTDYFVICSGGTRGRRRRSTTKSPTR